MEDEVFESTRCRDGPWAICREGDEKEGRAYERQWIKSCR